ncbi:MAG TPA: hypothetical protein VFN03_05945, partial [Trueperaceae bacterium]|nr:hypothetical protein [Trueperaceae bacterium]
MPRKPQALISLVVLGVAMSAWAQGPLSPAPLECSHRGPGAVYEVGPGLEYTSIGAVPWEDVGAGDTVRIHWRQEPYREKILISGQGTSDLPIT